MYSDLGVLILVGQVGAGKSEVARHLVKLAGARHIHLEEFRRRSVYAKRSYSIAEEVVSEVGGKASVLECTGTSRDFEGVIEGIRSRGIRCYVVLLECHLETALERVIRRDPLGRPRSGRSWASELRRTETKLRLVPVDHTISAEKSCPNEIAERILQIWLRLRERVATQISPQIWKDLSFSKLAAMQICPLSHELKYMQDPSDISEPRSMFLGRVLHETLAWMYGTYSCVSSKREVVQWFKRRLMESKPSRLSSEILETVFSVGEHALAFHYDVVFQNEKLRTIAVEKRIQMKLVDCANYFGRVDRISVDLSGSIEVIDYKTFDWRPMSNVRLPDRLQVAGYGAAVMQELGLPSVIVREISLLSGKEERFLMTIGDVQNVELALFRWARSVYTSEAFPANLGAHCVSCQFFSVCPEVKKGAGENPGI